MGYLQQILVEQRKQAIQHEQKDEDVDVFTGYRIKCPCCNKNLIIRCFKSGKHGIRKE